MPEVRGFFRTKDHTNTLLFAAKPSNPPTATDVGNAHVITQAIVLEAISEDETKTYFDVVAKLGLNDRRGWVKAEDVEPTEPPEPEPLDPWSFVKNCTLAARLTNSELPDKEHGINRDFMIAYALQETGAGTPINPQNRVTGSGHDQLTGPFELTAAQWNSFIDSEANEDGFVASDIGSPVFQCYGFAHLTYLATKALAEKFTPDDAGEADGAYIPNSIELYLYLALGEASAFAIIKKEKASEGNALVEAIITENAGTNAQSLLKRFKRLTHTAGQALKLSNMYAKLELALDRSIKRAFTMVQELTPEDIIYFRSGELPWFVRAQEELTKGIRETGVPPNPDIIKYFGATGYDTDQEDPWCGAFVAWCMVKSNDERAVVSVNKATAARAASWKTWGDAEVPIGAHDQSAVPQGAVVVLKPSPGTTGSSGHVGFFVEQDGSSIKLLGGNQSKQVKISTYPRSQVVAMRMLQGFDADPAVSGGIGTVDPNFEEGTIGPFTAEDWANYTQVLGHRESRNKYRAINRFGYCGRWQFGALALIDAGYVKRRAKTKLLAQNRWWTGKNGVSSRNDWLTNKNGCQDSGMISYTSRNLRSLRNIKITRRAIVNSGNDKAVIAGLLASSHLLGTGGTRDMLLGGNRTDANGVTGKKYYAMMATAFNGSTNLPTI